MDIYGVGIMLAGESGISKSETKRWNSSSGGTGWLVADDVVQIRMVEEGKLVGSSPKCSGTCSRSRASAS